MNKMLIAAIAAATFAAGNARAEGANTFEMERSARPIMSGQSGSVTGSETMPVFSGAVRQSSPRLVSDAGSETMPIWAAPYRKTGLASN